MLAVGAIYAFVMDLLTKRVNAVPLGKQMLMTGTPWALFAVFALVPSVSRSIFRVWSCKKFKYDEVEDTSVEFLVMKMSVRCQTDEHDSIIVVALGYLVIWPVLIPLGCLAILLFCRKALLAGKSTDLSNAVRILHSEYRPEIYFWEIVSLAHRMALTGYVSLIPSSLGIVRLIIAVA
eukprot:6782566-Prymnesium_polylepis.1